MRFYVVKYKVQLQLRHVLQFCHISHELLDCPFDLRQVDVA